jgi:thiol-disulfide isomerase/thioredoxin
MKKELSFFILGLCSVFFFASSVSPLWAAATPSSTDCPSCNSFGVQRPTAMKAAPPFALKGLDGTSTSLAALRGKPVLLFFWGTWCESCKEDILLLQKFAEGKKDQVSIITIVVDGEREKRARQIVDKLKITLPVLMILKEKVIDTYEIRMIPMAVVINQEGLLMGKIIGERDWQKPEAWCVVKELCNLN